MKYFIYTILLFVFSITLLANDGAYFMTGNQLIPIKETDIVIQKEILTITRKNKEDVEVIVYYEFFNPKDAKMVNVGFEALCPFGDVNYGPKNGGHPYMSDFIVEVNNAILPYKVAIVSDEFYTKDKEINALTANQVKKIQADNDEAGFNYVYHFNAHFKKGLNIVKHTYTFKLSSSIADNYSFHYILTAAMRWGNQQIDDFTLIINMGDFQDFVIDNTPFGQPSDWTIVGIGKIIENPTKYDEDLRDLKNKYRFYIQKGGLIFHKKNFRPQTELSLYSGRNGIRSHFDCAKQNLHFSIDEPDFYKSVADKLSLKILRNLPFARRGYVFTTPELQKYYEKQEWYMPNPNYKSDFETLTTSEQEWINNCANKEIMTE